MRRRLVEGRLHVFDYIKLEQGTKIEFTLEYGVITLKVFNPDNLLSRPYVGIVREIKSLDRVTIPEEYLKLLRIKRNGLVEISYDSEKGELKIVNASKAT